MGWLSRRIKEGGIAVSDRYAKSPAYFDLTPAGRTLIDTLDPLIAKHIRGRVLDAGAGRLTYTERLLCSGDTVISLDRDRVREGLSLVGDLETLPFQDGSFDSVFCSQVLEHVRDPLLVLQDFQRVLKPGGVLLLSVPHLAYLHNEPHDYYRYTEFGLKHLVERAGFELLETRWSGGLLSFLGHLPSTFLLNFCWGIPGVFHLAFFFNRIWSRTFAALESKDSKSRRFALNLAVVCRKPGRVSGSPKGLTVERPAP